MRRPILHAQATNAVTRDPNGKYELDLIQAQLPVFFSRFYRKCGRHYPWREKGTAAFDVLLAEMLLRQTRADQVAGVWPELLQAYPGPEILAVADRSELSALLRPLGLAEQRSEALRQMAETLVNRFGGRVPRQVWQLAELPHVGAYASHAVACFVFGQRVPVVDLNVLRVLGRLFGEDFGKDNRRAPLAWELAQSILPKRGSTRDHNYGLLDFAALVCKPGVPLCSDCELNRLCTWAFHNVCSTPSTGPAVRPGVTTAH